MAKLRFILTVGALLPITSCSYYVSHEQLEALNNSVPSGSEFTQRLSVEYRDLANQDRDQFDNYTNAELFSRKGLKAATGQNVPPEKVDDWSISGNKDVLYQGHDQLIAMLENGGREITAAEPFAAVAQARFDCWVERASHDSTGKDQAACHGQFDEALAQAVAEINRPAAVPDAIPQSSRDQELRAAKFLVFFDWNQARVTKSADAVIATAISESHRLGASQIDIVGNADLSGSERYNQKLSLQRALAVKQKLIAQGIPAEIITTKAHGDDTPLVPTARGVREPANRRVEIHFE